MSLIYFLLSTIILNYEPADNLALIEGFERLETFCHNNCMTYVMLSSLRACCVV